MHASTAHIPPSRIRIIAAFASIYVLWGSTYLAIRFGVETIPPMLMAGARHFIAGVLLYAWTRSRGAPRPTRAHWRSATLVGALLLAGGNGGVTWAVQHVPSGLASVVIATVPLWMVFLDWVRPRGVRPRGATIVGLALGLVGIVLLVDRDDRNKLAVDASLDVIGAGTLVLAALSWAIGSLYSRHARLPSMLLHSAAMQMLTGGAVLAALGCALGEPARLQLADVSLRSFLGFGYLVIFGSVVGFTSYVWLLRVCPASTVATYAYVNPVVALFLGWAFASEQLAPRTLVAASTIVVAVAVVIRYREAK
ncbi:MAG: EamA family transporter [Planctomycetota bacterium]